jgi:exopolyphosphatase/guanosine-5'-triphosphate,3'-diphosphate pyrophosphatase
MAPTSGRRRVPVGGAIDVGAYSVHLLVAEVHGHRLVPRHDESAALGLGTVVDERGELGFAAGTRLVETLAGFAATAREHGVGSLAIVGTDPLRRAADADAVVEAASARTGATVDVLRHEEEALLALLGAQAGRPVTSSLGLVDVGGGSSEVLVVRPDREPEAVGLPLGAARLSRTITTDPPARSAIAALAAAAGEVLAAAPDAELDELVAVGGTASNLLRVGRPNDGRVLTVDRIRRAMDHLSRAPADDIATEFGVKPSRARVLPGGAAILLAVAERYGLDRIRVSEGGLREGLILASVHGGPSWRVDLPTLARGWIR